MKMKYEWLDEYCLEKQGVIKDFKEEWDATRYQVGGKLFAMVHENKEGLPIISLKLEPSYGDFLRQEYTDITPGYYLNKMHWNSLYLEGVVPDEIVKGMIDESYQLIFGALSKKLQKEIMGGLGEQ